MEFERAVSYIYVYGGVKASDLWLQLVSMICSKWVYHHWFLSSCCSWKLKPLMGVQYHLSPATVSDCLKGSFSDQSAFTVISMHTVRSLLNKEAETRYRGTFEVFPIW